MTRLIRWGASALIVTAVFASAPLTYAQILQRSVEYFESSSPLSDGSTPAAKGSPTTGSGNPPSQPNQQTGKLPPCPKPSGKAAKGGDAKSNIAASSNMACKPKAGEAYYPDHEYGWKCKSGNTVYTNIYKKKCDYKKDKITVYATCKGMSDCVGTGRCTDRNGDEFDCSTTNNSAALQKPSPAYNEWERQSGKQWQTLDEGEERTAGDRTVSPPKEYPEGTKFDENGNPSKSPLPNSDDKQFENFGTSFDAQLQKQFARTDRDINGEPEPLPSEFQPLVPFFPSNGPRNPINISGVEYSLPEGVSVQQSTFSGGGSFGSASGLVNPNSEIADLPPNYRPDSTFGSGGTLPSAPSCRYTLFGWCVWR